MSKYIIVREDSSVALADAVNFKLAEGYMLVGGVGIIPGSYLQKEAFYQAMVVIEAIPGMEEAELQPEAQPEAQPEPELALDDAVKKEAWSAPKAGSIIEPPKEEK